MLGGEKIARKFSGASVGLQSLGSDTMTLSMFEFLGLPEGTTMKKSWVFFV